ncbi:MAG: DNA integrity scanning protein DisA nucleotide-binding domain protein [Clostridia bacterium]|nr:DNA integrity scanning protein DisA nucleotide-binding domain protein [Clostridia bacterium]
MSEHFESFKAIFTSSSWSDWLAYAVEFIVILVVFWAVFRVLLTNKAGRFIPLIFVFILVFGFVVSFTDTNVSGEVILMVVLLVAMVVFIMYSTEIKRSMLDRARKGSSPSISGTHIEHIMDEIVRAVQDMSKNNIGAFIVLSDNNLPEGTIESGTVVDAEINAPVIEAIFFPKAPLHDGAMVIQGTRIHAAGCFVPIMQSEKLPQDLGSRHRAALGITMVANVTAIVVSEETGIISLMKGGDIYKRFATSADIKNALSTYYWSDLTAEKNDKKGRKEEK